MAHNNITYVKNITQATVCYLSTDTITKLWYIK